jgi:hypothetical protein
MSLEISAADEEVKRPMTLPRASVKLRLRLAQRGSHGPRHKRWSCRYPSKHPSFHPDQHKVTVASIEDRKITPAIFNQFNQEKNS